MRRWIKNHKLVLLDGAERWDSPVTSAYCPPLHPPEHPPRPPPLHPASPPSTITSWPAVIPTTGAEEERRGPSSVKRKTATDGAGGEEELNQALPKRHTHGPKDPNPVPEAPPHHPPRIEPIANASGLPHAQLCAGPEPEQEEASAQPWLCILTGSKSVVEEMK
ncbi:unnamed protein product [Arctogadus glacialis]